MSPPGSLISLRPATVVPCFRPPDCVCNVHKLKGKKGSRVYAKKADGDFEAHLVALSCSDPPQGFARWSLRLLADRVVELDYIDSVSHETVRRILKKTNSSPGSVKDV